MKNQKDSHNSNSSKRSTDKPKKREMTSPKESEEIKEDFREEFDQIKSEHRLNAMKKRRGK